MNETIYQYRLTLVHESDSLDVASREAMEDSYLLSIDFGGLFIGPVGPQGPAGPGAEIATTETAGIVKPDGSTITVDEDGTLHAVGGGGGTDDHRDLEHRDAANQHPISAITGLQDALDGKQEAGDYATTQELDELADEVDGKQETISDLSTIRSGASAGATAVQPAALQAVTAKIPEQASADNQLADKAFVNSSIENVAAYYITKDASGNPFATKAELDAATAFYSDGQVRVPTRNDYCVVLADESKTIAETGENPTTRYIYGGSSWGYQYVVNRSGLTAAQWAAVNSNITAAAVLKLGALPTAAELEVLFAGKADEDDIPTLLSQLSGDSTHRVVTDAEKTAWNGKQNAISDLAAIRSNAAAGAALGSRVTAIEDKIPSQASGSNQLADKAFVNNIIGNIESLLAAL